MYKDEDGVATKQSQAVYNARIRGLLSSTLILSWLGLVATILNGEYAKERFDFILLLNQSDWSGILWASYIYAQIITSSYITQSNLA